MTPSIPTIYFTLAHEQAFLDALRFYGIPLTITLLILSVGGTYVIARARDPKRRKIAMGAISFGTIGLIAVLVVTVLTHKVPMIFSEPQMLEPLWQSYKTAFVEVGSSRTVDPSRGGITTSEGQSYTMLRAVWRGDKQTFDDSWTWTRENLERPDHLFAWLYVPQDFSFGTSTLTESDIAGRQNTASDADTTIALALIFAYTRWQDPQHIEAARAIITSIWEQEVIVVGDAAYVLANSVEKSTDQPTVLVNPSYLNPAAYRIFAIVDPAHPWLQAVDGSYMLLASATTEPLDNESSAHLPPDWVRVDRATGAISAAASPGQTSNFGYDAMRVVWNVALDWQWNHDERSQIYLRSLSFLADEWNRNDTLRATYSHTGVVSPDHQYEAPAMYGATIGYFAVADPSTAEDIYTAKLEALFDSDTNTWREELSYYDDNFAWFGIALYNQQLHNFTQHYPSAALTGL